MYGYIRVEVLKVHAVHVRDGTGSCWGFWLAVALLHLSRPSSVLSSALGFSSSFPSVMTTPATHSLAAFAAHFGSLAVSFLCVTCPSPYFDSVIWGKWPSFPKQRCEPEQGASTASKESLFSHLSLALALFPNQSDMLPNHQVLNTFI